MFFSFLAPVISHKVICQQAFREGYSPIEQGLQSTWEVLDVYAAVFLLSPYRPRI